MAVVESRIHAPFVAGRQSEELRVTHATRTHRRGPDARVSVLLVPHRGRGACLVSDTPGVGREPLSSSTHPAPSPSLLLSTFSLPRLFPTFHSPIPFPRSLHPSSSTSARVRARFLSARSRLCVRKRASRIRIAATMDECASERVRASTRTAKVRTHGRATPVEEGAGRRRRRRSDFYRELSRSCSNTVAPCVASLYTVERVTPLRAIPRRTAPYRAMPRRTRHISSTVG